MNYVRNKKQKEVIFNHKIKYKLNMNLIVEPFYY